MGQLGFMEMLIIFIVALLVFGPKKLPELGKSLGKGLREFKKATSELKSTWDEQVRDIEQPLSEVKRDINNVSQDLKTDLYNSMESEPTPAASTEPVTELKEQQSTIQPTDSPAPKEHV